MEDQKREGVITGYTRSNILDPVFFGGWWDDRRKTWQRERVVSFIIDYKRELEEMDEVLHLLKGNIARIYRDNGSVQDELWIIAQRVTRYV
jgi:hypothetical protein